MKKITLLLIVTGMIFSVTAQPLLTIKELAGNNKSPLQVIDNPNRSTPPGTMLYSQPFSCPPWNGLRSETVSSGAEAADDFIISTVSDVNIARWWFFMADDPATTGWIIRIYDNQACLPSNLLGTWSIAAADVTYEYVCNQWGWTIFDCWAEFSPAFTPTPNEHYWISIQAVNWDEYWCVYGNPGDIFNCSGAFRSAYHGWPDWIPNEPVLGVPSDMTFELYYNTPAPGEVPISNWAIGIGIFLILTLAVLRFRRMV